MKSSELRDILLATLILFIVAGFNSIIDLDIQTMILVLFYSAIIIVLSILSKKIAAYFLDSDIEHEIWNLTYFGFKKSSRFKNPLPAGIILPLIFSIITLGVSKFSAFLTYETRALKYRASKRFGFYSYTEMTDFHNGLIGAAGIASLILLSIITYFISGANLEYLAKMSIYYAFWNLIPISKLDGAQIFFGSRVLWSVLFTITSIVTVLALITA